MEIRIHRAVLRLMLNPESCYYLICVCLYVLECPVCGYIKCLMAVPLLSPMGILIYIASSFILPSLISLHLHFHSIQLLSIHDLHSSNVIKVFVVGL